MIIPRRATAAAALTLAASLVLAACSGGDEPDSGNAGGEEGNGESIRTLNTVMGPVDIPVNPERVVVLDTAELDSVLTLGVTPVGAVRADVESGFLDYLPGEELQGIANVGTVAAPNLEQIAELDPDLILSSKVRDEERYDELSQIAPTVFTETTGFPWKDNFQLHAAALGKENEMVEVIRDYENHVAEVTDALGGEEAVAGIEVSMLRFIEGGDTRIYGTDNYIGTLLADVGFSRPAITEDAEDGFAVEVSPEQVDLADGDVVFYTSYGSGESSGEDQAVGGPLWDDMTAVQNDMAFRVSDQLWYQGIGYTAAEEILNELQEHLAP